MSGQNVVVQVGVPPRIVAPAISALEQLHSVHIEMNVHRGKRKQCSSQGNFSREVESLSSEQTPKQYSYVESYVRMRCVQTCTIPSIVHTVSNGQT